MASSYLGSQKNVIYQDGATVDFSVKLGLIKLFQKEFNLCDEA